MSENEHWLLRLQDEVGVWSEANFGDPDTAPADLPLIGAGEELGELTTSVLKRAQGIDDSEKYDDRIGPAAEMDAIGDITLYLLDTVHRSPAQLDVVPTYEYWLDDDREHLFGHIDDEIDMIRQLYIWYGELNTCAVTRHPDGDDRSPLEDQIAELLVGLHRFCQLRGYDYRACVMGTWEDVSGREWDAEVTR